MQGWISTPAWAVPAATSQRADTTRNKTIAAPLAVGECRIRQSGVGSVAGWGGELDGSRIAPPSSHGTSDAEADEVTAVASGGLAGERDLWIAKPRRSPSRAREIALKAVNELVQRARAVIADLHHDPQGRDRRAATVPPAPEALHADLVILT
jgi:hypothetical protein